MALTAEQRGKELQELLNNGWKMTDGRDAIEKTFLFKVISLIVPFCFDLFFALFRDKINIGTVSNIVCPTISKDVCEESDF